jgi:hypothetical protein
MTIYYAGIGSRETPEDVCRKMFAAGRTMAKLGFILRSGGADGADAAFESGVAKAASELNTNLESLAEIYLPWKGFRKNQSPLYGSCKRAILLAKEFHPNWANVSPAGRDFHGRNCYQILGRELDRPSSFVLCWTKDVAITGGTGQALRLAQEYGIPILNFACHDDEYISDFILEQAERMRG